MNIERIRMNGPEMPKTARVRTYCPLESTTSLSREFAPFWLIISSIFPRYNLSASSRAGLRPPGATMRYEYLTWLDVNAVTARLAPSGMPPVAVLFVNRLDVYS